MSQHGPRCAWLGAVPALRVSGRRFGTTSGFFSAPLNIEKLLQSNDMDLLEARPAGGLGWVVGGGAGGCAALRDSNVVNLSVGGMTGVLVDVEGVERENIIV